MAAIKNALIIGGGFSGMSAAIQLRKIGVAVDLVEIDAGWRSYGAGISISGATLRACRAIGILPQMQSEGFCGDGVFLHLANGTKLSEIPTPRLAGPEVPGGAGIMRPVLAKILADATRASGTSVRLGCTFTSVENSGDQVNVAFTDGTSARYDLVIGADGLNSKTRAAVFPAAPKPRYSGQGVWRCVAPRPANVMAPEMYLGRRLKVGVNPVSQAQMYLFLTEDRPTNEYIPEDQLQPLLSALLAEFPAKVIADVRAGLGSGSRIVYRPLEALLLPLPWNAGRVLLIGDAVHATTPHMASGAGMGIEDAIVLAEELASATSCDAALAKYQERRWPRCRLVVENSLRLGELEQADGSKEEQATLMRDTMAALAAPC